MSCNLRSFIRTGRQFLNEENRKSTLYRSWGVRKVKTSGWNFFLFYFHMSKLNIKTWRKQSNKNQNSAWRIVLPLRNVMQRVKMISRQHSHTRVILFLAIQPNFLEKPESLYGRISCIHLFFTLITPHVIPLCLTSNILFFVKRVIVTNAHCSYIFVGAESKPFSIKLEIKASEISFFLAVCICCFSWVM